MVSEYVNHLVAPPPSLALSYGSSNLRHACVEAMTARRWGVLWYEMINVLSGFSGDGDLSHSATGEKLIV